VATVPQHLPRQHPVVTVPQHHPEAMDSNISSTRSTLKRQEPFFKININEDQLE
jgi:hypothetical protein